MGLFKKSSSCYCHCPSPRASGTFMRLIAAQSSPVPAAEPEAQPNPARFRFGRTYSVRNWSVFEVVYPDAKNYEGRKIIVYNAPPQDVFAQKMLDPHFCEGKHLSPFARFEPTDFGWQVACTLVDFLASERGA